jgi:hypothetical protein
MLSIHHKPKDLLRRMLSPNSLNNVPAARRLRNHMNAVINSPQTLVSIADDSLYRIDFRYRYCEMI